MPVEQAVNLRASLVGLGSEVERNDALGNVAVMLAALGVFGTGMAWPDLCVAVAMGLLALSGAWTVARHARDVLRTTQLTPPVPSAQPVAVSLCMPVSRRR